MISTGIEVALRSLYDDQEAEALLLGEHNSGHVRSAVSTGPPEHWADLSMDSGNWPI
jgi:hypothetical protein